MLDQTFSATKIKKHPEVRPPDGHVQHTCTMGQSLKNGVEICISCVKMCKIRCFLLMTWF